MGKKRHQWVTLVFVAQSYAVASRLQLCTVASVAQSCAVASRLQLCAVASIAGCGFNSGILCHCDGAVASLAGTMA